MSSHVVSQKTYYFIFAILMVLLVLTVGVAEVNLGPLNFTVAMVISVAKTVLIMLFFMHVRYSSRLVQLFAAAGFGWLMIMVLLTMSDYLTR